MAVKVKCPKCEREVDSRGIKAHLQTHKKKPAQKITVKQDPITVDLRSFSLGLRMGLTMEKAA